MRRLNEENFTLLENFINDYAEANGVSPTVREMAAGVGLSKSTVSKYLNLMKQRDMLQMGGCRSAATRQMQTTAASVRRFSAPFPAASRSLPRKTLRSMSSSRSPFSATVNFFCCVPRATR